MLGRGRRRRSRPRSIPLKPTTRSSSSSGSRRSRSTTQPVWKEIRTGLPQTTSLPGRETNVLIQPEGQTWRAARVPLATVGGFLFVAGAARACSRFYLWRGPIRLHGTPTGRLIERFTVVERTVHWTVAISFTLLAITGLILTFGKTVLLPLIGYTLFSWLAIAVEEPAQLRRPGARRRAADHDRAVHALELFRARATGLWLQQARRHALGRARAVRTRPTPARRSCSG